MAILSGITVDWGTFTVQVPRNAMTVVQSTPIEVRTLSITDFHETLRDIEDNVEGIVFPSTHTYAGPLNISGVTLSQAMALLDPYTITLEDGQYAVNIIDGNSNIADKININNVGVRTANSAGLQDVSAVQATAFGGAVAVDVNSIYTGTTYPVGTRDRPVNNISNAVTIALSRNIRTIDILSSMTLTTGDTLDGFTIRGESPTTVTVTVDSGAGVFASEFTNLTLTGTLDGSNVFRECLLLDCGYVNGFVYKCAIQGTLTLDGNVQASILDCYSNVAGGGSGQYAKIDMGGSGNSLAVRNWAGGLDLKNWDGVSGDVSIDMNSGRVLVESTVTGGDIYIRGIASVTDSSTGTATVIDQTINQGIVNIPTEVWNLELPTA